MSASESQISGFSPTSDVSKVSNALGKNSARQSQLVSCNFSLSPFLEFKPVSREEVEAELQKAEHSVSTVQARYTNALKGVHDYVSKARVWLSSLGDAKEPHLSNVHASVQHLLSKVDKWKQPSTWFRPEERTQIINDNNLSAEQIGRFDSWYQLICKAYEERNELDIESKLAAIEDHLKDRVSVESVKNYLRHRSEVLTAISPIVQKGFDLLASGKLPDDKAIPEGSDMIVFVRKTIKNSEEESAVIVPFARDGQYLQRFDMDKVQSGRKKDQLIMDDGPSKLSANDLYAFRCDYDPGRLILTKQEKIEQVGFAILRPGGHYGKNILFMDGEIPEGFKADSEAGVGTNTGIIYNLLRRVHNIQPSAKTKGSH